MGIRSTLKNMFGAQPVPVNVAPETVRIDAAVALGSRVHHEYFVADAADLVDLRWRWTARVYADNGAVNEESGKADTQEQARNSALTWCARVKASLGGEV